MRTGESNSAAKSPLTVVCAHCGRLIKGRKIWGKKYLSKDEIGVLPVSHGICLPCFAKHFPKEFFALQREGIIQADIKLDKAAQ